MTELEAYTQLTLIAGSIMVLPLVWRVFHKLGQLFIIKFFPPKYIKIEIQEESGLWSRFEVNKSIVKITIKEVKNKTN
jgi:hypothetical protein